MDQITADAQDLLCAFAAGAPLRKTKPAMVIIRFKRFPQATCVDVQHKKRGRPRLRDEEQGHGVTYGGESSHAHLYPAQPEVFDLQGSNSRAHTRTMSYREIRSRPGSVYGGASQTAFVDPSNPGYTSYQDALPSSYNIPETNPTALLTLEFVVLRSNYAFEEALSLGSTLQGRPLSDLLVASDRDKLQRLQNSLRAELQSKVHIPPIRSTAPGVALDIFSVTAGFQQRPEYWTFCLRNGQSHGFPISVSLAKTTTYFVILTLVATAKPSMSAISPTSHPSTYSALSSLGSVPLQTASQYQAGPPVSSHGPGLSSCRRQSSSSQSTMGYSPPTSSIIASTPRTSLHGTEATRDNLRHLQLPPIRTTGIGEGGSRRDIDRGRGSSAKESPQSAKRMKRRRVEIGEICGK
ncbi:hypothetical protein MMC13_001085 [Lambiella insularis]|nr:hypothetical protein [Lambiella insularis]